MPKPTGRSSVNLSSGKSSHLVVKHSANLPDVANPAAPLLGEIVSAKCKDTTHATTIYFGATVLAQGANKKRLALRIVSGVTLGGADITEGELTVTLNLFTGTGVPEDPLDIENVPVEYIIDPTAPC
jgi:hypothetical protein